MADDVQSNLRIDIDAAGALAELKNLQRQISAFHTSLARGSADAAAASNLYQQKLVNAINRTGEFSAEVTKITSTSEAFTTALERNKLTLGQYFRYAGGASKTFGKIFKTEFDTIEKTAIERVKTVQTQFIKLGRDANGALKAIKVRPLALDLQNMGTQAQIAAQKTQILNQLLKQGSTQLLNFGKNTQWAGRQLMVGFTVPLTMFGTAATKAFMDFEKQAIKFKRVYGETFTSAGETDKMLGQIKQLANEFTKYGVAVADTMEMAADAAAQGKMGADLLAQVSQATKLAILGNVEQQQALETTISITNAFGVATDQLAGKINFLNAVENQTVTSIEDLTVAIPKAGPVVKQLGGDVEDLAFFLTAMKEGGINASEGANALKSGLASLINPTKKASDFLAGFGVNIKGIVESNKGNVKGLVVDFAKALDTLDPLNRARAIEQLFGKFQFSRLSTLFQNVIAEGSQANRVLTLTKATTAELAVLSEREMRRIEASPMYKFQKAVEDLKVSLVPLGEAFVKAVTPIIQFGTKILEKFNNLDEGTKSFVTNFVGIIGVVAPAFLMGFGLIANGVANIIKLFTTMKSAYNRALDSTGELGVQTDYMSQAQLEAAAVAASLDQAHSALIQTFTSEATAVANLKTVYQEAAAAQAAFAGANTGMIDPAALGASVIADGTGKHRGAYKGYANGGYIQGPGTGTSDSIPIMASKGEVIIPAAEAKKNPALISALLGKKKFGRFATGGVAGGGNVPRGTQNLSVGGQSYPLQFHHQANVEQIQVAVAGVEAGALGVANAEAVLQETVARLARLNETEVVTRDKFISELANANLAINGPAADIGLSFKGLNKYMQDARAIGAKKAFAASDAGAGKSLQDQVASLNDPAKDQEMARLRAGQKAMVAKLREKDARLADYSDEQIINDTHFMRPDGTKDERFGDSESKAGQNPFRALLIGSRAHRYKATTAEKQTNAAWDPEMWTPQSAVENQLSETLKTSDPAQKYYLELLEKENISEEQKASIRKKITDGLALSEQELQTQSNILKQMVDTSIPETQQFQKVIKKTKFNNYADLAITSAEGRASIGEISPLEGATDPVTAARLQAKIDAERAAANPKGAKKDKVVASEDINAELAALKDKATTTGKQINEGLADGQKETREVAVTEAGQTVTDVMTKGEEVAEVASPSKRWFRLGQNMNQGLADGLNSSANVAMDAAANSITGASDPFGDSRPVTQLPPAPGSDPFGDSNYNWDVPADKKPGLGGKIADKASEFGGKVAGTLKEKALDIGDTLGVGIAKYLSGGTASLTDRKGNLRYNADTGETLDKNGNVMSLSDVAAMKSINEGSTSGPTSDGAYQDKNGRWRDGKTGRYTSAPSEKKTVAGQAGGKGALKVASKVSMGLAGATALASMIPGELGQQAQQWIGPMSAVAGILPMLSSGMGAATVAIGALVAAFMWYQGSMDAARKKGMALAEALGTSEKNIRSLAEFAGNATAGEVKDKERKDKLGRFEIKSGKSTFGESYVQSDSGKSMVKGVQDFIAGGGSRAMAQSQLTNQLATAVSSGAVSAAQARSIAANVGEAIGDYQFGIQVNAKMLKLLGPNGENLEKDPVGIRVSILEDSRKDLAKQVAMTQKASQFTGADGGMLAGGSIAGGLVGAGAGALSGLAIGAASGSAVGPIGTVIGAGVGIIAGAVVGSIQRGERLNQAAGAMVSMQRMALEQQQEMIDSLDISYEKRIAEAQAAGKLEQVEKLTTEHIEARGALFEEQGKLMADISGSYTTASGGAFGTTFMGLGGQRAAMNEAADTAITDKYKGTQMASIAELAKSGIKDAALTDEVDYTMRVALSTGDIDPMMMNFLMTTFGQDTAMMSHVSDLVLSMGTAFTGEALQVMNSFVDENGNPLKEQQLQFMALVSEKNPEQAQKYIDLINNVGKTGEVVPIGITTTFYQNNPGAQAELQADIDALQAAKDIDINVAMNVLGKKDAAVLRKDAEYFKKLPKKQALVYTQTMSTLLNLEGDPAMKTLFDNWVAEQGNSGKTFQDYVTFLTHQVTEGVDTTTGNDTANTPTGGGGGPQGTPIDELTKKLRDLRDMRVKATEGFGATMKEIDKWFNGKKTINWFMGLKNQMRAQGLGENLIESLIGMDPKEFEKKKKELFILDKKRGFITGLTEKGKELKEANDSVVAGEFFDKMQQQKTLTDDQSKAYSRLISAGMSVAQAYETIGDTAVAQMIAGKELTDKELKDIAEKNRLLQNQLKLIAAVRAIETKSTEIKDRSKLLKNVLDAEKNKNGMFNPSDMEKILADDNMRAAYEVMIQPGVDPAEMARAKAVIEDALKQANLAAANDLILKYKTGLPGLEEIFNDGMSKAMDKFNAQEKKIQIAAEIKMKPQNDIIEAAQDKLAGINYQIDDYDAGLKKIADQEDEINKAYDKKVKALDEVQKANEMIARQQQNQLSLADALAKGDIAAAARAAQEMRAQEAADALQRQRDALEKNKQDQIDALTASVTVGGKQMVLSKTDIEDRKKALQDEVFNIEETLLEPAQEAVRQIQAAMREDIQGLTVDGKSKIQWEELQNGVDLARTSSDKFAAAISNAAEVVTKLKDAWAKETGLTISEAMDLVNGGTTGNVAGIKVGAVTDANANISGNGTADTSGGNNGNNGDTGKPDTTVVPDTSTVSTASGVDTTANKINADVADRQIMGTTTDTGVVAYAKTLGTKFKKAFEAVRDFKDSTGKSITFARGAGSPYAGMNFTDKAAYDAKYAEYEQLGKEAKNLGLTTSQTVGKNKIIIPKYNLLTDTSKLTLQDLFRDTDNSDAFVGTEAMRDAFTATQLSKVKSSTLKEAIEWIQSRKTQFSTDKKAIATADDVLRAAYKASNGLNGLAFDNPANTPAKLKESYNALSAADKAGQKGKDHPYMKLVGYLSSNGTTIAKEEAKTQKAINTMADNLVLTNSYRDAIRTSKVNVSGVLSETDMKNVYASYSNPGYKLIPSSITGYATGGIVAPNGFNIGTDTVPAMLTPGEFVVKKFAVDNFGADNLKAINNGTYSGESVYNYNLSVNVAGTDISAQEVARVVMDNLKQIDSQRIRGTRF